MRLRYLTPLAVAVMMTAACSSSSGGGSTGASGSGGTAVKVNFLSIGAAADNVPTIMKTLMTDFAKTHPGSSLQISFIPQDQLDQKLQLLAGTDSLPEMFYAPNSPAGQADFGKSGKALNIEAATTKLGVLDKIDPAALKIMQTQQGGKAFALPLELNIEGFWYNKKVFSDNGITPPATWEDLVKDAAALDGKGVQPFAGSGIQGWPLTRLVSGYLFRTLGPDALTKVVDGQAKFTDPGYVKAAQAIADLGKKGYFGKGFATLDYQPAEDVFLQGKSAMFYMGSWAVGDFNDPAKNKIGADNVGFFPFPTVAGGAGAIDQTPENAGLPIMFSAKKYNKGVGEWLKYVVENYGNVALKLRGQISGFEATSQPADLSPTTKLVIEQIKATKEPLSWFEGPLPAKAGTVSTKNAAQLINGNQSASDFMSKVQAAMNG